MSTADPRYERDVLAAFRAAVATYCTTVDAAGRNPDSLRISVSVATLAPMSREFGGKVHRIVHRHVDVRLPRARVISVGFLVDPFLPEPGHRFVIQPPALPAPKQTLPLTHPPHATPHPRPPALPPTRHLPPPAAPATATPRPPTPPNHPHSPPPTGPATAHLTLRYGADFRWVCHLASAPGWIPLGRWTGKVIRDASVRLPEYATFLPRGELLYLRHDGHRVEFARSRVRPDYLVTIDGAPLYAGGRLIRAGTTGSIGYTGSTTSSTRLDYHLAWGEHP